MKVFKDFRDGFKPVYKVDGISIPPGRVFRSEDGRREVAFGRSRDLISRVTITIDGVRTTIVSESAYDAWWAWRPLPGEENGWY